jgi:hypothetical protein
MNAESPAKTRFEPNMREPEIKTGILSDTTVFVL